MRESRPDKLHEISSAEVHQLQVDRISSQEHTNLINLREISIEHGQPLIPELASAAQSLQHAEEHLFERKTDLKDHELMTEALRHGRGSLDLGDLRGSYEFEVSQGKLLQVGGNVATKQVLSASAAWLPSSIKAFIAIRRWVAGITLSRRQVFGLSSVTLSIRYLRLRISLSTCVVPQAPENPPCAPGCHAPSVL